MVIYFRNFNQQQKKKKNKYIHTRQAYMQKGKNSAIVQILTVKLSSLQLQILGLCRKRSVPFFWFLILIFRG